VTTGHGSDLCRVQGKPAPKKAPAPAVPRLHLPAIAALGADAACTVTAAPRAAAPAPARRRSQRPAAEQLRSVPSPDAAALHLPESPQLADTEALRAGEGAAMSSRSARARAPPADAAADSKRGVRAPPSPAPGPASARRAGRSPAAADGTPSTPGWADAPDSARGAAGRAAEELTPQRLAALAAASEQARCAPAPERALSPCYLVSGHASSLMGRSLQPVGPTCLKAAPGLCRL